MIQGHTIALYSTGKCDGVTMYHLSVDMCAMDVQKNKTKNMCFLAKSNKNKTKKRKKYKKKIYSYFSIIQRENKKNIIFFYTHRTYIYLLINDTWSHHRPLQ